MRSRGTRSDRGGQSRGQSDRGGSVAHGMSSLLAGRAAVAQRYFDERGVALTEASWLWSLPLERGDTRQSAAVERVLQPLPPWLPRDAPAVEGENVKADERHHVQGDVDESEARSRGARHARRRRWWPQRDGNPCSCAAARFCQRISELRRVESTRIRRGREIRTTAGLPKIRSASLRRSFGYAGTRTAAFVELDDRSPSPI